MAGVPSYDLAPTLTIALVGGVFALLPVGWVAWRHWRSTPAQRLRALSVLAVALCFDLVVFGAFTRLTDSGLGCPDWPGCYGHASPLGAKDDIHAAQTALPTGPVTHAKAWIEMVHRYLATGVGALIVALAVWHWRDHLRARRGPGAPPPALAPPIWATLTVLWVCLQGAFGAWTVTLKLYPAIVTAHLLGGLTLLGLLTAQAQRAKPQPLPLPPRLRLGVGAVAVLLAGQVALGGWVSTNYAVLACDGFPTCQGRWWPNMDFDQGFTLLRGLGLTATGEGLPFAALTAIHYVHRLAAYVVLAALLVLAAALWRHASVSGDPAARGPAKALVLLAAVQLASGVSNVVLGWPLLGAVGHTAGAAGLVVVLASLAVRQFQGRHRLDAVALRRPMARSGSLESAPVHHV